LPESWTAQRQQLPQAPPLHLVPATAHPWPWLNNRQQTTNGCPFPFDCMTCAPEIAAPHTSPQTHEAAGRSQVRTPAATWQAPGPEERALDTFSSRLPGFKILKQKALYTQTSSSQTPKKSLETLYRMDV
jgi:hypothetical protein